MSSGNAFRFRDTGLVFLAIGSGSADVMAFVVFGSVFTSAMTGNTALIGIAAGSGQFAAAVLPVLALVGFVCGAALAIAICRPNTVDPTSATRTVPAPAPAPVPVPTPAVATVPGRNLRGMLLLEIGVLSIFALVWHLSGSPIARPIVHILVMLSAAAMGIQGIAAKKIAAPGINTIVLTSTMLGIVATLTERMLGRSQSAEAMDVARRQISVVIGYATGATVTSFLTWRAIDLVPWPPLAAAVLSWLCMELSLRRDSNAHS